MWLRFTCSWLQGMQKRTVATGHNCQQKNSERDQFVIAQCIQKSMKTIKLASFPGPAQLFVTCSTENSDGKLGGAWVRGQPLGKTYPGISKKFLTDLLVSSALRWSAGVGNNRSIADMDLCMVVEKL